MSETVYFTPFLYSCFMPRILLLLTLLLQIGTLAAQKKEQGFDPFFKPTDHAPRYFVTTEKKDSLWYRQAWYLPERSMAMEGWYKDEDCKTAHGEVLWYHENRFLKSKGTYENGQKQGTWLEYGEDGKLRDSATYTAGRLTGIRMQWYADGMPSDSSNFDGKGNGVEVRWFDDGSVASAGRWIADTAKNGRWQYFFNNGKLLATEDYIAGNRLVCTCYDEAGKALDTSACKEKEAEVDGGITAWRRFLERNLKADIPAKNGAAYGRYTVVAQFVVNTDGSLAQIRALTKYGYGMEEEVVRILQNSPPWKPALQFGRKVKAYRKQPITFVVAK
jgi:antitoxin component YwqK of YwqJK toxin-antitoxin module